MEKKETYVIMERRQPPSRQQVLKSPLCGDFIEVTPAEPACAAPLGCYSIFFFGVFAAFFYVVTKVLV